MVVCMSPATEAAPALPLRPYQVETIRAIRNAFVDRKIRRQLIALPTGAGKTVVFSYLLNRRYGRGLILVHRDELVSQTIDKLMTINPMANVGVVKAERNEIHARFVVASIQTLSRQNRLDQLDTNFETIIVDECHHSTAESYLRVLTYFGVFNEDGPLCVGFTATPERGDKRGLGNVFQEIVYRKEILEMMTDGYLSDVRAIQIHLELDLRNVKTVRGDYHDRELAAVLRSAQAARHVVDAYREHAVGRKTLVFTPSVAMAYEFAETFREAGIRALAFDATTGQDERREVLRKLKTGEIDVLCNCLMLTEGFDEPSVNCVILARPTKSKPLYIQMMGRGLRPYPGKDHCLLIDIVGSTTEHDLQTASELFNLDPQKLAKMTVTDNLAEIEREEEARQIYLLHHPAKIVSTSVDLFKRHHFAWVATGDRHVVGLPGGWLALEQEKNSETWRVMKKERGDLNPIELARGLTLGYAQGFAEDFLRKKDAVTLADRSAPWRRDMASDKQLGLLQRLLTDRGRAAEFDPNAWMTKGEAAEMITQILSSPRRRKA